MPYEKAPSSGAFSPLSLMYFLSGEPMHDLSGVDTHLVGIETVGSCSVNRGQHDDISCQTKLILSNRMIDADACTTDNQSLLFGVRTNYCETKYPPEKFIPVYRSEE